MERLKWKAALIELPLAKLSKAKWNYKLDDEEKRAKLTANLKRNGQVENLVVREIDRGRFEVINGNHRLDSMTDAAFKAAYCFNVGKITKAAAVRLAIELNETRFETNHLILAERISDIAKEFDDADLISTLPYNEKELAEFKALLNFNWEQFQEQQGQEGGAGNDFISISAFFAKLGISAIPTDLADKLEPALQQLIDREELSKKNAFMIFDAIYAALAEEIEAGGGDLPTGQNGRKKK